MKQLIEKKPAGHTLSIIKVSLAALELRRVVINSRKAVEQNERFI